MPESGLLYNTDFIKAIRKNKRNCFYLVSFLVIIMALLGYLLGAFLELQTKNTIIPEIYSDYNYNNDYYEAESYRNHKQANITFREQLFIISNTGLTFAFIAICISILWSVVAVFFGKRILLSSANATEIQSDDKNYLMLNNIVEELSIASGIQPPKVYVIETDALNAFATGMSPDHAAVAVTRGLLEELDRDELQGVMAHEMGHVINYDIRYQTLVSVIVGLIILLSDVTRRMMFYRSGNRGNDQSKNNAALILGLILLVFSIVAPIASLVVQMAVSRQREYMADATSVKLTRNPLGLISALTKLEESTKPFTGANRANQNLFIVNPFKKIAKIQNSLFATHPQIAARIARLRDLGGR